ncbi:MAG: phosphatase PAP2 family protein [Armatimonadota bacterium]|nr:phosphatase PAP2 family protein [Armatimonadota bacterium]MDR7403493.1 phosphatase PAP2 family protein [Armatimonadota bacterium]
MTQTHQWGLAVIVWLQQYRSPVLDAAMRGFTFIGDEEFYLALLPFLAWCVDFGMGMRVGAIFLLSVMVNSVLKDALMQPRPPDLKPSVKLVEADGYGLPSGHAQAAAAVWGTLGAWARTRWAWGLAATMTVLVGVSGGYLGVHFPTDVLAGWTLGSLLAAAVPAVLPAILPPVRRMGPLGQVTAAVVLPAVAAGLHPTHDSVAAAGALAGLGAGLSLMRRSAAFSARGPWGQRMLRYAVGATVALGIYFGLRTVLPGEPSPTFFIFRFLRYGLVGLWVSFGGPWVFGKVGLAGRGGATH